MTIRPAGERDWPAIWPIWHAVVSAGDTYCWPPDTGSAQAREWWMLPAPAEVWVAADPAGTVVGTYVLKPNQPGPGSHVANGSFMVDPARAGRGVGRALGEHFLRRAAAAGYLAVQFNAVVSTNTRAVRLWRALGFTVVGTVPDAFRLPDGHLADLHIMHRRLAATESFAG